jgi:hypothetical protein
MSVVMVGGGVIWRTPLDPTNALLTGLHYGLPFFLAERVLPESLPSPLHLPWPVKAAAVRGARPLPVANGG